MATKPNDDSEMILTDAEFIELEANLYHTGKLPPLYESIYLWTGTRWLITHLWKMEEYNYRWDCMGDWAEWPVWVKIKEPSWAGSEITEFIKES